MLKGEIDALFVVLKEQFLKKKEFFLSNILNRSTMFGTTFFILYI